MGNAPLQPGALGRTEQGKPIVTDPAEDEERFK